MHLNVGGLISVVGGIYGLLVAFRLVRVSKNPDANEVWLRKFGPMMKILCPLLTRMFHTESGLARGL